jgi:site-specific DNA recombinase
MIFARYLALKSFQKLIDELNHKGIVTKKRPIAGRVAGGIPFTSGPLSYLLKNRCVY